jgi:NADPH-dependent curcumin reductase CurA
VLKRRPAGKPVPDDFALDAVPVASIGEGEFTVRNRFISLDPGLRQRLSQVDS